MIFQSAAFTGKGSRENNEDAYRIHQNAGTLIAVVADGLGGHLNGEIASEITVTSVIEHLSDAEYDEDVLIEAILNAHSNIIQADISGHSTVAALWLTDKYAAASHVGDSRFYHFRDGNIRFQSLDHSVVQLAALVGDITEVDIRHHKDRNKLFRVLGDSCERLIVDSTELPVLPGDSFLLCTDGFWEAVTEQEMLRTLFLLPYPTSLAGRYAGRAERHW